MSNLSNSDDPKKDISSKPIIQKIPKGSYKSGRFWKSERDRFRSTVNVKALKVSLKKNRQRKAERKEILDFTNSLKAEKRKKIDDIVERKKINLKRRLMNEQKAEIVQVISNSRKVKRMAKKRLKNIETRDLDTFNKK